MEEVYVGLARVYGEEKDLISLLKTAQKRLAIAPNDSHFKRYQQEYSSLFALAETIESRPHIQSHQQKVINGTASVESYLITLQSILQKGLKIGIDEREREFALFNLFHLQRLGATVAIVDMARLYNDMHCSNTAEFILGKLVEDGSTEQRVYTTLAEIVRAQNTGAAHSLQREEWAKWLDWKAQEVYKGQLERRYQERLQPLQEAIRRNSDDAEPYIQTLQALFEKNESRAPQGEEAEFGRYNLYHAVRLGQTSRLVQWAQSFYDQGHSESAEFILDKIVKEDSRDSQAYTLLAQIVRAQNIGTAHSLQREEWAKWLDWKAREVQ
jgi:hypothetical protein